MLESTGRAGRETPGARSLSAREADMRARARLPETFRFHRLAPELSTSASRLNRALEARPTPALGESGSRRGLYARGRTSRSHCNRRPEIYLILAPTTQSESSTVSVMTFSLEVAARSIPLDVSPLSIT